MVPLETAVASSYASLVTSKARYTVVVGAMKMALVPVLTVPVVDGCFCQETALLTAAVQARVVVAVREMVVAAAYDADCADGMAIRVGAHRRHGGDVAGAAAVRAMVAAAAVRAMAVAAAHDAECVDGTAIRVGAHRRRGRDVAHEAAVRARVVVAAVRAMAVAAAHDADCVDGTAIRVGVHRRHGGVFEAHCLCHDCHTVCCSLLRLYRPKTSAHQDSKCIDDI